MATWTVSGLGSNSTGSFTFPANTGTTDKSYTVTYNDGNGNTATTSVTVPACDIEYLFAIDNDSSKDFACSGGTGSQVISSVKESSDGTVYAVGCSVTSAPSWISSYSLTESSAIGSYLLSYTVPASTTGSRSGTFTITQNESGKQVYAVANQPSCTAKTVNNITSYAVESGGAQLNVYLQSEKPVGTSITCEVMVTYTAKGRQDTTHLNVTIPRGSLSGSNYVSISGTWRFDSCCITATNLLYEDDTYDYRYSTCGGVIS